MRTTLDLPDETFRKLKAEAALRGLKLKELVTQIIEGGLAAGSSHLTRVRQRSPLPIAIPRVPGSPMTPALTNAQLNAILETEDLAEYRRVLCQPDTFK